MPAPITRPLLALDTSTPVARVAVLSPAGERLASAEKQAERHSSNLLGLVDAVLAAAGLRVAELGAIACGAGPGSFTGLRVGLAVAKGLALPDETPLVLVRSLDALALDLAQGVPPEVSLLLPCIDAGKGQVYGRLYRAATASRTPGEDDLAIAPDELCGRALAGAAGAPVRAGGNGVDRYLELFRARLGAEAVLAAAPGPSAVAVGRLALDRLARGERDDLEHSVPYYGRPPDITRPKKPPGAQAARGR